MRAAAVIELVQQYLPQAIQASSATVCLRDAQQLLVGGDERYALQRALKALAYCVGVLHPAYAAATAPSTTGA